MVRFGRKAMWTKEKGPTAIPTDPGPSKAALSLFSSSTAANLENRVSTYHVYQKGGFHHRLTPERDAYKNKVWPSWAETKRYMNEKREAKRQEKLHSPDEKLDLEIEAPGFFVHKPRVCFGHPPRTLRRGQSKHGAPLCLINNSWFWRRWQIQFCDGLDEPGIVDPRGIVGTEHGYANRRDSIQQRGHKPIGFVQGYPVKKWRFWGDTGKEYHQSVNKPREDGGILTLYQKPLEVPLQSSSPGILRSHRVQGDTTFATETLTFLGKVLELSGTQGSAVPSPGSIT